MKSTTSSLSAGTSSLTSGPMLKKIILYTIPLMLSGMLQLLFNAADIIVVGRFTGPTAVAAVGSTGSLTSLIVNLFIGLSVGCSVSVAQYYGSGDEKDVSEVVHTSIVTSIIGGFIVMAIGVAFSPTFLAWMDTPADVIDQSALYMRIYFCGMPVVMLYNFASAILRSIGDTRNPLIFLSIAGVVNVILNMIFVIAFHMGVAGVALATIISQALSATLLVIHLARQDACYRLDWRRLRIHPAKLWKIIRIGVPAGLQSSVFSISNVVIQSSINSFGSVFMSGNSAAANIEGFAYTAVNSFHHAALTFAGQNMGAKKYDRVNRALLLCLAMVTAVGAVIGFVLYFCGPFLLNIYLPGETEAIASGMIRLTVLALTYFLCGLMDAVSGAIRGMGFSLVPMLVTVFGVCGTRIIWVYTIFTYFRTPFVLFLSYPISWLLTLSGLLVYFFIVRRRFKV